MSTSPATSINDDVSALLREHGLRHIAIIMDGNRRWASQRHMPGLLGHQRGVEALKAIVRYCGDIGLEALTVYAFSTENWRRGEEEVGYLLRLFVEALSAEVEALHRNNVRLRFIGELSAFPPALQKWIETAHERTRHNSGLQLQIAANYGAHQEILQAARALGREIQAGALSPEDLTESMIEERLYTHHLPRLDLLIRTGGEHRVSNFLLWQLAYAELYICDRLWPDFSPAALDEAIREFVLRERRYGQ